MTLDQSFATQAAGSFGVSQQDVQVDEEDGRTVEGLHLNILLIFAQNPLDTFSRSFNLLWGSCQLVADLLWRNWCNGFWPLVDSINVWFKTCPF